MSNYKLSAPILEGTIPPFYKNSSGGIEFSIPFTMNRAVSWNSISGFKIKIKSVISGKDILNKIVNKSSLENNVLTFTIQDSPSTLYIGQFYKIQIAYLADDDAKTEGYFSSVAISKYTAQPEVYINGLQSGHINAHSYDYTGVYSQEGGDWTEQVYSYKFNVYSNNLELLATSGEILHNVLDDDFNTQNISYDHYTLTSDLESGKIYFIEYCIKTINGLEISSPKYRIQQKQLIDSDMEVSMTANLNYENGYVDIRISSIVKGISGGFFIVSRATEDTNYLQWEEVYRFHIMTNVTNKQIFKDFTVEQGKKYQYSLQQYNTKGLHSKRILLKEPIVIDFEDAFLTDGKRQLKIKYNPKVSSFKRNVLETKVDTIGGAYPFIFRNGRVSYNEFPISGLISYLTDSENLFLTKDQYKTYYNTEDITNFDLVNTNIIKERIFKMEVLNWLTNGEPKIFRSATEGNFIVRLMNSSLTPNDTLGRMIHTFNSTAYEISEFNYENLKKYNIINLDAEQFDTLFVETVEFLQKDYMGRVIGYINRNNIKKNLLPSGQIIKTIKFYNMMPGEEIEITFAGQSQPETIKIGVTGTYLLDVDTNIEKVALCNVSNGYMEYTYEYSKLPTFEQIEDAEIISVPIIQFIGEHDIIKEIKQTPLRKMDSVSFQISDEDEFNNGFYFVEKDGNYILATKEHEDYVSGTNFYTYSQDSENVEAWVDNPKVKGINIHKIIVEKRPLYRIDLNSNTDFIYSVGTLTVDQYNERPYLIHDGNQYKIAESYNGNTNYYLYSLINREESQSILGENIKNFFDQPYFYKDNKNNYHLALNNKQGTYYYQYKINDPWYIYEIGVTEATQDSTTGIITTEFKVLEYYDTFNHKSFKEYNPSLEINNVEWLGFKNTNVNVNEIGKIEFSPTEDIEALQSGNGVMVSLSYSLGNALFKIESEAEAQDGTGKFTQSLCDAINSYKDTLDKLDQSIAESTNDISKWQKMLQIAYDTHIIQLIKAQQYEARERGEQINEAFDY